MKYKSASVHIEIVRHDQSMLQFRNYVKPKIRSSDVCLGGFDSSCLSLLIHLFSNLVHTMVPFFNFFFLS